MPRRARPPRTARTTQAAPAGARVVEHAQVQFSVEDASAVRFGFEPSATVRVVLSTMPGTGHWFVEVLCDDENPLLAGRLGIALQMLRRRYDEPRARTLYTTLLRAIELADISRLRKVCPARARADAFFCWAFGLRPLEQSLASIDVRRRARG